MWWIPRKGIAGLKSMYYPVIFHRYLNIVCFWILFAMFKKYLFSFLAALGLCWCSGAFSSCSEWGATLGCSAWASHCGGLSCCRAQAVGVGSSHDVWARWLWPRGLSCSMACGILLDQGLNQWPPASRGGFLTTGPPGKTLFSIFKMYFKF